MWSRLKWSAKPVLTSQSHSYCFALDGRTNPVRMLFIYVILYLNIFWTIQGSKDEQSLYESLLSHYNPLVLPVNNSSQALLLKIRFTLRQIMEVDAKKQIAQVQAWIQLVWHDEKLHWNPEEHAGIRNVHFLGEDKQIWYPDILLYNRADDSFDWLYKSNTIVQHTGKVEWVLPAILKFSCKLDITWFPFDDQLCILKFGSWTHNAWRLQLQIDAPETLGNQMDLSFYIESAEWRLYETPAKIITRKFECCPEPYQTVTFTMHIGRRSLYYVFNLIFPSFVISLMTILGFTLPPNSGEKVTLESTVLFSIFFFLGMVSEMTPPTSEAVPLIGVFFLCCMMVVTVSVIFTILIINLHFRSPRTHVMSPILRRVLLVWLPWVLGMSRPGKMYVNCGYVRSATSSLTADSLDDKDPIDYGLLVRKGIACPKINLLHRTYMEIRQIARRMTEEDEMEQLQSDWSYAGMVIDRACLIIFTVFITISLITVILMAPHIIA